MASVAFQIPVAIILLAGGLLACFLGYRLLRTLLALYGFIAGVVITTLFVGDLETWLAVLVTIGGGLAGSMLAVVAYLAGIALLGAGVGALVLNIIWASRDDEPNVWFVLAACLVGALMALAIRHHVLIMATSFGGAWTAIVGGLALTGNSAALSAARGDLQQLPPMADVRTNLWFVGGWVVLGLLSMLVQLRDRGHRQRRQLEEQ